MQWNCKYCNFTCEKRGKLLKHYRLKHGGYTRALPLPCLHKDCPCTFKSFNALKVHLSRAHSLSKDHLTDARKNVFQCQLCDFREPCTEKDFFSHLRTHIRMCQKVQCPYMDCDFKTSVYATFNAHKSKNHDGRQMHSQLQFKPGILTHTENLLDVDIAGTEMENDIQDETDFHEDDLVADNTDDLECQLEHNLAALFLRMRTVLNVSERAVQDVIQQIQQLMDLSKPLLFSATQKILLKYYPDSNLSVAREIVNAISENNAILKHTQVGGSLSTTCRRASYTKKEFGIVEPIEFVTSEDKQTMVYIPVFKMLQALLNKEEILHEVLKCNTGDVQGYNTFRDGSCFKENTLLVEEKFAIALGLYIDDFEVANPLGTSKKKHKIFSVYWALLNLASKFRSSLNSIQLALLCKVSTVKACGYSEVLRPLLYDLELLEKHGVYVEKLGSSVRGTVLHIAADNLAAHSLGGFLESFVSDKICRFCMATRQEIQDKEVSSGHFFIRTKQNHDQQVLKVQQDPKLAKEYGVKTACPFSEHLEHFHVVGGFPPDILHDLLEGIVPSELSICIQDLIKRKFLTLEMLNSAIKDFPYQHSDKTNQPQVISKIFQAKGTVGGNGHENWSLIRLIPLLIDQTNSPVDCDPLYPRGR